MATSTITHRLPASTGSVDTLRIFRKETKYEFLKLLRAKAGKNCDGKQDQRADDADRKRAGNMVGKAQIDEPRNFHL